MYKIIGADQREYGPCSADDLRRWFREGRLNGQTMIQAEGGTEWKPLAAFPEFASLLSGALPPGVPPTIGPTTGIPTASGAPVPINDLINRDYDLDIFGCVSRAWSLLQKRFWPIIGVTLLVSLAMEAINQMLQLVALPLMGVQSALSFEDISNFQSRPPQFTPGFFIGIGMLILVGAPAKAVLMGGLYRYYLKLIRHEPAELADAFSGFSRAFLPLVLIGLVRPILEGFGFLMCFVPFLYLAVAWTFAVPLVIDRQIDFWAAMELSRKLVTKHWFVVLGFLLINGLVASSGIVLCCVGLFLTIPLAGLPLMYAYEDIFGHRTSPQA